MYSSPQRETPLKNNPLAGFGLTSCPAPTNPQTLSIMKELDNELDFLNGVEDMPDFEEVEIPEETNDVPELAIPTGDIEDAEEEGGPWESETPETEEESTEAPESAESEEEAPKKEAESKPSKPNPYEVAILEEMKRRATTDELLAKGLESADKTIAECFRYVTAQARKEAVGNCAMIEDNKAYGWAVHYYIEPKEVIDKELAPKTAKKAPNEKTMKKIKANPLLASLMDKKGYTPTEDGAVVKTTTMKGGMTKETKVEDKAKTITLKGKAGELTFTQYSLF